MNKIAKEFNALAKEYESNRLAPWYKAHALEIVAACPPVGQGDILEVGCGTGFLLRAMLKREPCLRGVGLDIAEAMIVEAERLATQENVQNARFLQADWESLDLQLLAEYDFRVAFCANAFHYFSDPRAAAEKFHHVLPVGGSLYVLERNTASSMMTRGWGWLHRHVIKDNVEFYCVDQLLGYFRNAGFNEARVVRSISRIMWKKKLYTSIVLIECVKS
jgi:ubiquinone/menaquinone biosynthesis C-methylase UbiE